MEHPGPKRVAPWVIAVLVLVGVLVVVGCLRRWWGEPSPPVMARTAHGRYVTATGDDGGWKLRGVTAAVEPGKGSPCCARRMASQSCAPITTDICDGEGRRRIGNGSCGGSEEQDWEKFTLLHGQQRGVAMRGGAEIAPGRWRDPGRFSDVSTAAMSRRWAPIGGGRSGRGDGAARL